MFILHLKFVRYKRHKYNKQVRKCACMNISLMKSDCPYMYKKMRRHWYTPFRTSDQVTSTLYTNSSKPINFNTIIT